MKDFLPYSKETQLKGHQRQKPTPKIQNRKRNRKKKNQQKTAEFYKGVKIPHRKVRGRILKKDYVKATKIWGECCTECGKSQIEMHHVMYKSQGGRGYYTNLHPLCKTHHDLAHRSSDFRDKLRQLHEKAFGKHYYFDRYDAWKSGFISSPEQEKFEEWMKCQGE